MKNLCFILLSLFCIVSFISVPVPAEVIDKIVALLDDELILLSEVRERTDQPVVRILANLERSEKIEQDALPYVIEERLLQREIQYLAFPKDPELNLSLATQYIIEMYHNNDPRSFEQQLQDQSITDSALEEGLTLYLKGIDYIRRKYRFNADINDPNVILNLFRKWIKDLKARTKIQPIP